MAFLHSPQPNLGISAEPASPARTKFRRLSFLLALLIVAASLTPAWGPSAARAKAKATAPARFTVAAPPPAGGKRILRQRQRRKVWREGRSRRTPENLLLHGTRRYSLSREADPGES
jgi:hypothetical protein